MNRRPSGYEPDELPGCSTPHQKLLAVKAPWLSTPERSRHPPQIEEVHYRYHPPVGQHGFEAYFVVFRSCKFCTPHRELGAFPRTRREPIHGGLCSASMPLTVLGKAPSPRRSVPCLKDRSFNTQEHRAGYPKSRIGVTLKELGVTRVRGGGRPSETIRSRLAERSHAGLSASTV